MLRRVKIENFRCIETAELEFDRQGTGIVGPNASGKTSLLEALFFLGNGRSFRTTLRDTLRGPHANFFRIFGELSSPLGLAVHAGVEFVEGRTRLRVGGNDASSISSISELLPIQVIDPGIHRLVEEGSARRRRQLDWGVFHVKHEFLDRWRRYHRALQQRNAALRAGQAWTSVSVWDEELAKSGEAVDALRAEYMAAFQPCFAHIARQLIGSDVTVEYRRGWSRESSMDAAIESARVQDRRLRTTTVGPHRADLSFRVDGAAARDRVSRGQQKMLAAAFVLAQTRFRAEATESRSTLLLDDPAAELDVDNLGKLLAVVAATPAQLVVTSVSRTGLQGIDIGRLFHVEQGQFSAVL